MEIRKANRKQSKIKMALQGPSGSGKTYSSLLLAYELAGSWNKVAIIDTENFSADLYSHVGDYNVLPLIRRACVGARVKKKPLSGQAFDCGAGGSKSSWL